MDNDVKHSPELSEEELEGASGGSDCVIKSKKKIVKWSYSCEYYCCRMCYMHISALEGDKLNQRHQCPRSGNYYMGCYSCLYYSSPGKNEGECNCPSPLILTDFPGIREL